MQRYNVHQCQPFGTATEKNCWQNFGYCLRIRLHQSQSYLHSSVLFVHTKPTKKTLNDRVFNLHNVHARICSMEEKCRS